MHETVTDETAPDETAADETATDHKYHLGRLSFAESHNCMLS